MKFSLSQASGEDLQEEGLLAEVEEEVKVRVMQEVKGQVRVKVKEMEGEQVLDVEDQQLPPKVANLPPDLAHLEHARHQEEVAGEEVDQE